MSIRPLWAQTAIDILGALGLPAGSWSARGYMVEEATIRQLGRLDQSEAWRRIVAEPPAYFWYRSSPEPMVARKDIFNPWIDPSDPPLTIPGMVLLILDAQRRLLFFRAVPGNAESNSAMRQPFEWRRLWAAAGLDAAQFSPTPPLWTPPSAFNERAAWIETQVVDPRRV